MLFSFFTAILLHEAGHLLALALTGGRVLGASLSPFGITLKAQYPASYLKAAVIDLAGAAAGILAFFLFRGTAFSYYNLLLALFNLLPIASLDGGKALASLLLFLLPPRSAEAIAKTVSLVFTVLLWVAASYAFLFLDASPSLFFLSLWLFLSAHFS